MGAFGKNGVFIRGRSDRGLALTPSPRPGWGEGEGRRAGGRRSKEECPKPAPRTLGRKELAQNGFVWQKWSVHSGSFGCGHALTPALSPGGARERDAGSEIGAPMKERAAAVPASVNE